MDSSPASCGIDSFRATMYSRTASTILMTMFMAFSLLTGWLVPKPYANSTWRVNWTWPPSWGMIAPMPEPKTPRALAARKNTQKRDKAALEALHAAIVDDLNSEAASQAELVRITGYTREHIRLIAKAAREAAEK
jgi:hypothetical protein